ncbi:MAG: hypothetical protein IT184_02740 [Acidobacteria bacterium]|nr:hypothetical protein [Acidobacteriota bacterium]
MSDAPRRPSVPVMFGLIVLGAVIGGMAVEYWLVTRGVASPRAQAAVGDDVAANVAHLMSVQPTQGHTMKDVGDHWANLWFAVRHKNWTLGRFFFDQARQSARWTVAIRPTRELPDGSAVDVKGLWTAADMSAFAAVQIAIEDQNAQEFDAAYRQTLDACHACHTALRMSEIKPAIPTAPASTILSFDPLPAN